MSESAPDVVLVLEAVVGTKANKLVKGATSVVEVNARLRAPRTGSPSSKPNWVVRVNVDYEAAVKITDAGRRRGRAVDVGSRDAPDDLRYGAAQLHPRRAGISATAGYVPGGT